MPERVDKVATALKDLNQEYGTSRERMRWRRSRLDA